MSPPPRPEVAEVLLDLRQHQELKRLLPELLQARVIYLGESHTNYAHHLKQLEIITQIHQADPELAIALEMFQWPQQAVLDHFIAGELDHSGLLHQSEWFSRWGYDYALYRPILEFAREQCIPLVAINLPSELVARLREVGWEGLTPEEQAQIPHLDQSDEHYQARLQALYQRHPPTSSGRFDRFLTIQLAWDETMAQRIAEFLIQHPERRLVVLAGSGHLAYRSGIPQRVERRTGERGLVLLPAESVELAPGVADFAYTTNPLPAPPRAQLGVALESREQGVFIKQVMANSPAEQAGLLVGDQIAAIEGQAIHHNDELRITLLEYQPGDTIELQIHRSGIFGTRQPRSVIVTL